MRILAIDFGTKRIGVAVSDPSQIIVHPIKNIEYSNSASAIKTIKAIIENYAPLEKIILGYPKSLKNNNSLATKDVEIFAQELKNAIAVPIEFWDERFTSKIAAKITGKLKKMDKVAAAVLLEDYLHRRINA